MVDDVEDVSAVVEVMDVGSEELEELVGTATDADFTSSVSEYRLSGRIADATKRSKRVDSVTLPQ